MSFKIEIASVPDYADLLAEVWFDDFRLAEVPKAKDRFDIEFYPAKHGQPLTFDLQVLIGALLKAKARLGLR